MRYAIGVIMACGLIILGIGEHIEKHQRAEAERGAKELRPHLAKVELIQKQRCKGICHRTFVSFQDKGVPRVAVLYGSAAQVGQTVTAWAKPGQDVAYASPDFFVSSRTPAWSPVHFLLLPLLALLAGIVGMKLKEWPSST